MENFYSSPLDATTLNAIPEGVEIRHFPNGLTLITKEDFSAPVVSAQAWCETGSIHEGNWLGAGLSHVLEHMLFKGTSTRPAGRIDQEVQEAGGYLNAYTSFDRTVYWIDVPDAGAAIAVDVLCDIMQHATLPPGELNKELDVIRREMDMGQDDPNRRSSRRLFETAFSVSPYRYPVIGIPDIFNQLKPEDITGYYAQRYVPNNIFLVVIGAISSEQVNEWVEKSMGTQRARPLPYSPNAQEPRQTGPRIIVEQDKVELGHLHIAWHVPDARHTDCPALDVLTCVLGQGQSSRLFRELRERQRLVHHVDSWLYTPGQAGLFGMSALYEPTQLETVKNALMHQYLQCLESPVSNEELDKVKRQFASGYYARLKSMHGQASELGSNWLLTRNLSFSERYMDAVMKLTPQDILLAAQRHLIPDAYSLYALVPESAKIGPKTQLKAQPIFDVRKIQTEKGLTVLHKEDHRLPFIELRLLCLGGVTNETVETGGHTLLMSKLLLKGTESRDAETIAREIESVGGSISSYGGNNSFGVTLEILKSDFDLALDILENVLTRPSFPQAELDRERDIQIAGIKARKDHLLQRAYHNLKRALYGEKGYGLDNNGTEASLMAANSDQLKERYQTFLTPANSVLAVYGSIDATTLDAGLEKLTRAWNGKTGRSPLPSPTFEFQSPKGSFVFEQVDKKQAVVILGFPGVTVFDEDHFALDLLQECCSDLGSRLFLRIREELGLAYYVGAQNFLGLIPGLFSLYAGTASEEAERVIVELRNEAELLATVGVTEAELKRAKAKIVGQKKIARQDLGQQAMSAALDELYGMGFDHHEKEDKAYEQVTLEDISRVAKRILDPTRSVVSVCSPKELKG